MPVSVRRHVLDLAYHGPAESANDARAASGASIARAQFLSLGIVQVYLAIFVVGGALLAFLC